MSTTLRPTPPVAPATRTISEVPIVLTTSLGEGSDSFSTRKSKNFTIQKQRILISWSIFHTNLSLSLFSSYYSLVILVENWIKCYLSRRWEPIEEEQCFNKSSKIPILSSSFSRYCCSMCSRRESGWRINQCLRSTTNLKKRFRQRRWCKNSVWRFLTKISSRQFRALQYGLKEGQQDEAKMISMTKKYQTFTRYDEVGSFVFSNNSK